MSFARRLLVPAALLVLVAACDEGRPSTPGGGGGRGVPPNGQSRSDAGNNARTDGGGEDMARDGGFDPRVDAGFERDDSGAVIRRDTGVVRPNDDASEPPFDSGVAPMCGDNPFGCSPHELLDPRDCSCLGVCEPGWRYDPQFGGQCVPEGDGGAAVRDTGVRDGGVTNRDGGFPRTDGGVSDPFNMTQAVSQWSDALCRWRTRCEPALYPFTRTTEVDCRSEQTIRWTSVWGAFGEAARNATMVFRQAALTSCIASMASADCVLGLPPTCDGVFTGVLGAGQPCSLFEECARGTFCEVGGVQACGACRARAPAGQSCASDACEEGSSCYQVGTALTCVRDTNLIGARCGTVADGVCQGRLQCVNGLCARPAALGGTCDAQLGTGPDCDIYLSHRCVSGQCQRITWVGPNSSCSGASGCDDRGVCSSTTMTCTARPGSGSPCLGTNEICAPDLFCDNGTCRPEGTVGSSCTGFRDCANGLFCQSSQTCRPLEWSACP